MCSTPGMCQAYIRGLYICISTLVRRSAEDVSIYTAYTNQEKARCVPKCMHEQSQHLRAASPPCSALHVLFIYERAGTGTGTTGTGTGTGTGCVNVRGTARATFLGACYSRAPLVEPGPSILCGPLDISIDLYTNMAPRPCSYRLPMPIHTHLGAA